MSFPTQAVLWFYNITLHSFLKGDCSQVCGDPFSQLANNRTKGNGLRFYQRRFILDVRKNFFHSKGCQALEEGTQGSDCATIPEVFQRCVDVAPRDMIYWRTWQC